MNTLTIYEYPWKDLFNPDKLATFDQFFLTQLKANEPILHISLIKARKQQIPFTSNELIKLAEFIEYFLATGFSIEEPLLASQLSHLQHEAIFLFKKHYVLKLAKRRLNKDESLFPLTELDDWLNEQIKDSNDDQELAIAKLGQIFLQNEQVAHIEKLTQWCIYQLRRQPNPFVSFKLPEKLNYQQLIDCKTDSISKHLPEKQLRGRAGFALTDHGADIRTIQDQIHYCVYCHKNHSDYCSKGFLQNKHGPIDEFKKNTLGNTLTGCPLDEKISEMQWLKRHGHTIAALAMIMRDNPMCPATGHRICNDCMKACIYQKQTPVNIPEIETRVLTDVLQLPYGVEIYDLLTRWNPLRETQYIAKPYNGYKILVAGLGPAGFTLAHHLLMEGCAVVGFDGLKLEPGQNEWLTKPIKCYQTLTKPLDKRPILGFGGVAEYGITARWNKNFLTLIYITLLRRPYFQCFGSTRFGGSVDLATAWQLGFDHLAVAVGAGLPKALPIKNSMAPGMRQANDFLMNLQVTGAHQQDALIPLQLRLPIVVIGSGLTAVDTATEASAYYVTQVIKNLYRYEILCKQYGEQNLRQQFDEVSLNLLDEQLNHAKKIAQIKDDPPALTRFLYQLRAVSILYRKHLIDSPAYINNHEELKKALEEGIFYYEALQPESVILDDFGHCQAIRCHKQIQRDDGEWVKSHKQTTILAKSILVATGAKPNIAYEFENAGSFKRDRLQYQTFELNDGKLHAISIPEHCKKENFGAFASYQDEQNRFVSIIGDTHPLFHGSVVKAIASAKKTYTKILDALKLRPAGLKGYTSFAEHIKRQFDCHIQSVHVRNHKTVELIIHHPLACQRFLPGQFYKLQTYQKHPLKVGQQTLHIDNLILSAATADKKTGCLHFIVIQPGMNQQLIRLLKHGQPVALMGPTGVRTRALAENENMLIAGGALAATQALAMAQYPRANNSRLVYLGEFDRQEDCLWQTELEAACEQIIWLTKEGPLIKTNRPQDISLQGDFLTGFNHLQQENNKLLSGLDRIQLITFPNDIKRFQHYRTTHLNHTLKPNINISAAVYAPMQCALKGVCAQCLQWQVDPDTGQRTKAVYACSWQHQPIDIIDIDNLAQRQSQNTMSEKLAELWLGYLLEREKQTSAH